METKTRVLIADTNDDFKRLMTEVVRNEEDLELVGCIGDGVDALAMVAETKPDVLVLDLILAKLDGIEVLAVIFSRRLGMTVGTFVMAYNAILYIVAGAIMSSWVLPLYSIVTYAIGIKAVDFIVEGLDKTKAAMIITDHPQDICRELSAAFRTGITLIDAHGYYSGDSKTMIYFVVNRFQIARMRTIVHDIDAQAFISITEVSDLFGKNAK